MGFMCPECKTHQAIVASIGSSFPKGPERAEDVIAYKLACGHTVGFDQYQKWAARAAAIRAETQAKIDAAHAEARAKLAAAWDAMMQKGGA